MKLKIGTFNIAAGLQPDTQKIQQVLKQKELSLIGLQEVDVFSKRNPRDLLTEIAGDVYPYQDFQAAFSFPDGGEYGNGILSQSIPESVYHQMYAVTGEEPRLFQEVIFEMKNQEKLAFYNTHLSFETPEIRKEQAKELKARIAENACRWQVIAGDFNFDQSLSEWEVFSTFQGVNGRQGEWFETFLMADPTMKNFAIDNLLVSQNIEILTRGMLDTGLSDHALLWAEIALK